MRARWVLVVRVAAFGMAVASLSSASPARAEDKPDAARAAMLFEEGRRSMAINDFPGACFQLAESQALDPRADTAFELGFCYQRASEAAFRTARVMAGDADLPVAVAPLPAPVPTPAPASPPLQSSADDAHPGQAQRVIGVTLGGVGAAGILAGVIAAFAAKSKYDEAITNCPTVQCGGTAQALANYDSSRSLATGATVSIIAGAAALTAGAFVYFLSPSASPASGSVGLGVAPTTGGASVAFAGRF